MEINRKTSFFDLPNITNNQTDAPIFNSHFDKLNVAQFSIFHLSYMSKLSSFFAYSIGRKVVMALTGLFLVSFLVIHLSGNLQLFTHNPEAFNVYTRFMTTSPLIKLSEIILVLGFLTHIFLATKLSIQNNTARPTKYAYKNEGASSAWTSRNMGITGSVILIFLGLHLYMFYGKFHYGAGETVPVERAATEVWKVTQAKTFVLSDGKSIMLNKEDYITEEQAQILKGQTVTGISMFKVASDSFQNLFVVIFYVAAMLLLGLHLNHGFQSAFRSIGFVHSKYTPLINGLGLALCVVVPAIFAAMPLYHFIMGGK